MLDQNTFTETVRAVKEIVRTSAEPMTRAEMLSYFKDMDLNEQQEELVVSFLTAPQEADPAADENDPADAPQEEPPAGQEPSDSTSAREKLTDSPVFQMYLDELKEIPVYTKQQQAAMEQKLLAGDAQMVQTLANAWLSNVLEVAKKLAVAPEGFEDIVQEGNMALVLRLGELCGSGESADVEKELLTAIEEAMKACIREQTGADESENTVVGKVALVSEAKNYLKAQNDREPSVRELADYVRIPESELSDLLDLIEKAKKEK